MSAASQKYAIEILREFEPLTLKSGDVKFRSERAGPELGDVNKGVTVMSFAVIGIPEISVNAKSLSVNGPKLHPVDPNAI
jgi:hypothetical protein